MSEISRLHIRRYWFGVEDENTVASTVLLMERDRLDQYRAALDFTEARFSGVFSGITGTYRGHRLSVIYSIGPAHVADCVSFLSYGCGVKRFIATGSIGGLSAGMGDIVITSSCTTQDGFSLAVFASEAEHDAALGRIVRIEMPDLSPLPDSVHLQTRETFGCEIRRGPIFTVPAVCVEEREHIQEIKNRGYIALDLETGPFLGACRRAGVEGFGIHWVTDLPLERSFYYQYDGKPGSHRERPDKETQTVAQYATPDPPNPRGPYLIAEHANIADQRRGYLHRF